MSIMYQCLKRHLFVHEDGYTLVPIREQDMESIRVWRNSQIKALRQNHPLTEGEQVAYFRNVIKPSFSQEEPAQILFSFLYRDQCIGYGGFVHIDWVARRAEFSFLVSLERYEDMICYYSDFTHFLDLLCQIAFKDLAFHRLHGITYTFRDDHIKIIEEMGFRREGTLRDYVYKDGVWHDAVVHGLLAGEHWKSVISNENSLKQQNQNFKQTPNKFSVLITSISKKMGLIQAVRNAGEKLECLNQIFGADSDEQSIAKYGVDVFWHCPLMQNLTKDDILRYCQENSIHAIIPTRDQELPFFAEQKGFFETHDIKIMVSSPETVNICLDKKAFADHLMLNGYLAIPTELSLSEISAPYYVVKERHGAGAHMVGLKLSKEEAIAHGSKLKEPIFQPYIQGVEWSVDLYRTSYGEVKGIIARRRDLIVNGESQITTTRQYPELETLCTNVANLLNIEGHALFQVMETAEGRLWIIECNPRFGGASTASLAVGLDSFYWFFLEYLGKDLHHYPFKRLEQEIRQVRYPVDQVIPW